MFRKGLIAAALVTAALLSVSQTAEARKNKDSDRVAESSQTERNFMGAKRQLTRFYFEHRNDPEAVTFYCGCRINYEGTARKNRVKMSGPDWKSCGYRSRSNTDRAERIEWEHIMPAHQFGSAMKSHCWQNGGRKNCEKTDPYFMSVEADMHNLVPSVGEVNGDRSNFRYDDLGLEPSQYGQCEMVVDFEHKAAQPPKARRGVIARTHLYMADRYGIKLNKNQQRLFEAWNRQYPVSEWECTRNSWIKKVQGNGNKFVEPFCR